MESLNSKTASFVVPLYVQRAAPERDPGRIIDVSWVEVERVMEFHKFYQRRLDGRGGRNVHLPRRTSGTDLTLSHILEWRRNQAALEAILLRAVVFPYWGSSRFCNNRFYNPLGTPWSLCHIWSESTAELERQGINADWMQQHTEVLPRIEGHSRTAREPNDRLPEPLQEVIRLIAERAAETTHKFRVAVIVDSQKRDPTVDAALEEDYRVEGGQF